MGQPARFLPYIEAMAVNDREDNENHLGGQLQGGVYRPLMNPNYGVGLAGEGYIGRAGGRTNSGVRLMGALEMFFLHAGIDYSFNRDEIDAVFSLKFPLRRGGLFKKGDTVRIDWIPGRDNYVGIGFSIPLGQPYQGKTRPIGDHVELPKQFPEKDDDETTGFSSEMEEVFKTIHHAADWINRYTTPFFDQDLSGEEDELAEFREKVLSFKDHIQQVDDRYPGGHTFNQEVRVYHHAVRQAFAAVLKEEGDNPRIDKITGQVANQARQVLLEDVILPYNRLLGQNKTHDTLKGYVHVAEANLGSRLESMKPISPLQRERVIQVFRELADVIEQNRVGSHNVWKDSKLVWIPLHYALTPEECDSQEKMNHILEQVAEDTFVGGNQVDFVINEQFHAEVARMIRVTRDYHVLWIHDYRGNTPAGEPDKIGLGMTVIGYLEAMTERVREYDQTGHFPTYLIIIDEFYYAANNGRLWMDLLENPLGHHVDLPPGYEEMEKYIQDAQKQLRSAVAGSVKLQEMAKECGPDWLTGTIKVHVNVTNRADFSFRSAALIDNFPVAPDILMRDHRKISFYDVTEADPSQGEAIYSGLGIGEHYAGPTWEDRALLVRGPVLVSLKEAARLVLLQQGIGQKEVPRPLREVSRPVDSRQRLKEPGPQRWDVWVMDVHNETGFRSKPINAVKAALYSLMPPGSLIVAPDSLWNSPFWGGMLTGAALRGCRILVIAPSLENAPSAGFPQMSRAHELFSRLIVVQQELGEAMDAEGGMLKTGIYTRTSDVGDTAAKLREFDENIQRYKFIEELFPFPPEVSKTMKEAEKELKAKGYRPTYYADDIEARKPKLHLKTNFFATRHIQDLMSWQGWDDVIGYYLQYRSAQTAREEGFVDVRDYPEQLVETAQNLVDSFGESLGEEEYRCMALYLMIGSQNQDYRGMIMDGEVAAIIAGYHSLIALGDTYFLVGLTTWVDDEETLNELLPPQQGWRRWLGRYIMKAL